jgi:hypothetical protein
LHWYKNAYFIFKVDYTNEKQNNYKISRWQLPFSD